MAEIKTLEEYILREVENLQEENSKLKEQLVSREDKASVDRDALLEEFSKLWATLSPFDRAAFEGSALDADNGVLRGYLIRLGVLSGDEKTLQELAAELDAGGANDAY